MLLSISMVENLNVPFRTLDAFIIGTATVLSIVPLEIDGFDPVSIVFARATAGAAQPLCSRLWFSRVCAEC